MSDVALADVIVTYFLDPVDTLTSLLQWCVLYLAHFPLAQSRLYKHVQEAGVLFVMFMSNKLANYGRYSQNIYSPLSKTFIVQISLD